MAGEELTVVEELRTLAQYQLAIHPSGIPGSTAQKTFNTFLQPALSGECTLPGIKRISFALCIRESHPGQR